ncbi:MAG: hypothetical protein L3J34_11965 [Flavobacteriaceae bacterium]|nr:hypothetical protein [Flavobacteriaceae bacterium]
MKFLVITCIKEFEKETVQLFKKAKITAFSNMDINGFKTQDHENLINNWFSSSSDNVKSSLFFTFTDIDKIDILLKEVKTFNENTESNNPLRAVVLNIENFV